MPDESLAAIHGRLTEDQTADQDSAESPFVYPDSFNPGRPVEISSSVDGSIGNPNDHKKRIPEARMMPFVSMTVFPLILETRI